MTHFFISIIYILLLTNTYACDMPLAIDTTSYAMQNMVRYCKSGEVFNYTSSSHDTTAIAAIDAYKVFPYTKILSCAVLMDRKVNNWVNTSNITDTTRLAALTRIINATKHKRIDCTLSNLPRLKQWRTNRYINKIKQQNGCFYLHIIAAYEQKNQYSTMHFKRCHMLLISEDAHVLVNLITNKVHFVTSPDDMAWLIKFLKTSSES